MKQKYVDLSILYLKYRNSYNTGFQKYQYYKSMIRYVTDIEHNVLIRRIFDELLLTNLMEKKYVHDSVRYRFNPYHKKEKQRIFLNFD
tara:strand:+ start:40 stop:303 length:264 start_codon:yes stop_codon:yes gene_type:complete